MTQLTSADSVRSPDTSVEDLRKLRDFAARLNNTVRTDLEIFLQENNITFRRLPGSNKSKVNVTTTCTVQMALASNDLLNQVYHINNTPDSVKEVLKPVVEADWRSSGLL